MLFPCMCCGGCLRGGRECRDTHPGHSVSLYAVAEEASDLQRGEAAAFEPTVTVTKLLPVLVYSPAAETVPPDEAAFKS
jgi:hypothetical protein